MGKRKLNPTNQNKISEYASEMERKMRNTFPTTSFAEHLKRERKSFLEGQNDIIAFLTKFKDFDLNKNNIDRFLKKENTSKKNSDTIRKGLKSIQRIFKLVPDYDKTIALLKLGFHSAQSIVTVGEDRFVKIISVKTGIMSKEAKEIFKKAEISNTTE